MTIFIEDTFDAAHFLPNVPVGHKCRNLHGHTYKVRIEVTGEVEPASGWVIDYAVVKEAWTPVKALVDHKCLNYAIPELENSTCENLAQWIWGHLKLSIPDLSKLEVRETANCGVVYTGEGNQ